MERTAGLLALMLACLAAVGMSRCASHSRHEPLAGSVALRNAATAPLLADQSYTLPYRTTATDERPRCSITLHHQGLSRTVEAVLDTGDPGVMTIGAPLAAWGRAAGQIESAQGAAGVYLRQPRQIEAIEGLGVRWESAIVNVNLDDGAERALVGLGFLKGASGFILDHGAREMRVLVGEDPGSGPYAASEWSWTRWDASATVEFERPTPAGSLTVETERSYESERPFILVWVSGAPVPCVVDTGAQTGLVLPSAALMPATARPAILRGHGATLRGRVGRLHGVEIAGRRFDDVEVFASDDSDRRRADADMMGVVGMGILGRQPVWFDIEGKRLGLGTAP